MIIEEAVAAHLLAGATSAGIRIYPNVIPQTAPLPALAYQRISGARALAHDGPLHFDDARFQITCTGDTYAAAKTIVGEVRALFHGFSGVMGGAGGVAVGYCEAVNEMDGYNSSDGKQTVRLDIRIAHAE